MKRFRLALIIGIVSTICLISSFSFFLTSQSSCDYNKKKYLNIMHVRSDSRGYKQKLDAFNERWKTLGEFSHENSANVSYDITIEPSNFDELNEKVLSTYEHGFFFLKSAVLEGTPDGVRLAVAGFKKGDEQP
jgi:hypothetical protein